MCFRNLAIPGTVALVTNALGFMVIMLIDIPIVHELGVTACLGVLLMIMTNKMILPIILSHLSLGRNAHAAAGDAEPKGGRNRLWWTMAGACVITIKKQRINWAIASIRATSLASTWRAAWSAVRRAISPMTG